MLFSQLGGLNWWFSLQRLVNRTPIPLVISLYQNQEQYLIFALYLIQQIKKKKKSPTHSVVGGQEKNLKEAL